MLKSVLGRLYNHFPGVLVGALLLVWLTVSGCASHEEQPPTRSTSPAAVSEDSVYDANSWKTLIPASCQRFSDGCNQCVRNAETGNAACTRKACFTYGKPQCLDGRDNTSTGTPEAAAALYGGGAAAGQGVLFQCQNGHQFQLFYKVYQAGDMRMKLQDDQVMLSDRQTHSAHLLTRVPSASGSRYQGDGLELWNKGKEAIVDRDEQPLYRQCQVQ